MNWLLKPILDLKLSPILTDLAVLKWMMGVLMAGVLSLVLKAFFLNLKHDWLTRCCAILPTAIALFGFKQGRVRCALQPLNVERYAQSTLQGFVINGSTLLREWVDNG